MRMVLIVYLGILLAMPVEAHAKVPESPADAPPMLANTRTPGLPEMPGAAVSVPWTDFKALLIELLKAEELPKVKKEVPPFDYTIGSAQYMAEGTGPATLQIEARFQITVWKEEGWIKAPLLGSSIALENMTLDGESVAPVHAGEYLVLPLRGAGSHSVVASFYVRGEEKDGVVNIAIPSPISPVTEMNMRIPVEHARITAPKAASTHTAHEAGSTRARLVFQSTDNLALQWTLPAKIKRPAPPEPAWVACEQMTLAGVSATNINCEAVLGFNLLRGQTDTFTLALPDRVNVLHVEGQGAAWTRTAEDGIQTIHVKVNHQVTDRYSLRLHYDVPFEQGDHTIEVPLARLEDVARQSDWAAISARDNVELAPGSGSQNVSRVDVSELPGALREMSRRPIQLAYRTGGGVPLLALEARRLEDAPVRPATIESAEATTVVTEDGALMTCIRFAVLNNMKQYLRVQLPEDVSLWYAEVGGEVVKPAKDKEEGTLLIPLYKSVERGGKASAFPVEILYEQTIPLENLEGGPMAFALPPADLPINKAYWDVLLPENLLVTGSSGDVHARRVSTLGMAPRGVRQSADHGELESIMRLREGVERFLITDINNAAAMTAGGSRYTGRPLAKAPGDDTLVAGVLPVKAEMPVVGRRHLFERIIVPADTPLLLELRTRTKGTQLAIQWALLIALATTLGFAYLQGLRRWTRKWRVVSTATTVFLLALAWWLLPDFTYRTWILSGCAMGLCVAILTYTASLRGTRGNMDSSETLQA